ncbi:hypothetical protein NDU88_008437 [Pleurodeles waltl]|uniref:Uncharacterized protein n=1 Tax=Pleurodeles waltl TaxID=8319 RepID=A0AAV7RUQ8_PLEWA|nr:hypothetical protein NDU88_008437 [Pleurodeles waltl]
MPLIVFRRLLSLLALKETLEVHLKYPRALCLMRLWIHTGLDNLQGPGFWGACVAGINCGQVEVGPPTVSQAAGAQAATDSQAAAAGARTRGTVGSGKASPPSVPTIPTGKMAPTQGLHQIRPEEQHSPRQHSLDGAWPRPACPGCNNATVAQSVHLVLP